MNHYRLENFLRGWFVGDFSPSIIKTNSLEVAVQKYAAGVQEAEHVHKLATEITVIVSGRVEISGKQFFAGDIIEIKPGEFSKFTALEPTVTVVVKYPSAKNDKYLKD